MTVRLIRVTRQSPTSDKHRYAFNFNTIGHGNSRILVLLLLCHLDNRFYDMRLVKRRIC